MLDRLPPQLQLLLLLEWLSPETVYAVAHTGSASLRCVILTSPRAFQAAEGEVLSDACVRWFHRCKRGLVLWTETIEPGLWCFFGGVRRYCNGKLHSEDDQPAVVRANGTQEWYQNGKHHRDNDRPAIIRPNGTQLWYRNGLLHRDRDLPAIVCLNGYREWYKNGEHYYDEEDEEDDGW